MHLQAVVDYCHEIGRSRSTMEKIKALAIMLYDYAIQNDITNKNYANFVQLPDVEQIRRKPFSDLDVNKLEKNADTVEWVDTILILIYSGMRITEMLTLTKFNIDLKKNIIVCGIKTEAGKGRIIPIHPKILKYITSWYNKNGETLIFKDDGNKITPNYYRNYIYYPALDKLGIEKLSPHSCRHTFATLMADAGVEPLLIQRILGHKKYSTTADTYTHPDIESLKNAMGMI